MTSTLTLGPEPAVKTPRKPTATAARQIISPWLVVPAVIPVILFSVYPLMRGVYLGFTDARAGATRDATFNGLTNYADLFTNQYLWASFKVGTIWGLGVTALTFFAALGLALLLNTDLKLRWLARALAIAPWAMPPAVIGYSWQLVYADNGLLNSTLHALGIDAGGTGWLSSTTWALPAAIVVGVWAGMPQTTVVLLAGLQSVPEELKEAARLDGAGALRVFLHVTWPNLRGVAIAIVTLDFIWNFNSFGLMYVLTQGGPGGSTQLPMLFAYQEAFKYGNYGVGAAIGNVMMIITGVIVLIFLSSTLLKERR